MTTAGDPRYAPKAGDAFFFWGPGIRRVLVVEVTEGAGVRVRYMCSKGAVREETWDKLRWMKVAAGLSVPSSGVQEGIRTSLSGA